MATQTDKIQLLENELKKLGKTLTYYGELFNADGEINSQEQQDLDRMQAVIRKIEAKLVKVKEKKKKKSASPNESGIQSKEETMTILSNLKKELNNMLDALN